MVKVLNFLLLLVLVISVKGYEFEEEGGGKGESEKEVFLLHDSEQVVETEAGFMKVVKGIGGRFIEKPMHIGFITMEPKSLFIPQYLDSSLIMFIRRGEAKIGSIREDELVEQQLSSGDVYRIDAGSAFYIENTGEGQRLQIICSIDTSESLNWHVFQSFFIGGGRNSILAGFDKQTMSTALNISIPDLREFLSTQKSGAIVFMSPDSHPPSLWKHFVNLEKHEKKVHLKRLVQFKGDTSSPENEEERPRWTIGKLLVSLFGKESKEKKDRKTEIINLYNRDPDFKNKYGWSMAIDESEYKPLGRSGMGIYLVNLTAGSMMAPHINPTATEYGIVLRGSGTVQIVYPNGTMAMNTQVKEGDVFWVPRYFPFCQISSRSGPFEFFGFTTSSRKNWPQFLVGQNSLLQTLSGPETAAAFGMSEEKYNNFSGAQHESTILTTASVAPTDHENQATPKNGKKEKMPRKITKKFGDDLLMGYE